MKNYLINHQKEINSFLRILIFFTVWRVSLFIIAILSQLIIPKFGAQFPYFNSNLVPTGLPGWIWGFGNFDGVHYLRIAQGYISEYSQVFFPLYPLLIQGLSASGNHLIIALLISNLFFLLAIFILYKLWQIDFKETVSKKSLLLLLIFPTSFYFASIYTESLFLFLTVSFFYSVRRNNFLLAGICAGLASATRVIGILLFPLLILELYFYLQHQDFKLDLRKKIEGLVGIIIAPLGLILYMVILKIQFNDPLYFLNAQLMVNTQRTNHFVLLPQVFYRYLKILFSVDLTSPQFYISLTEFLVVLGVLILIIFSYKKIRVSYLLFSLGVFLMPTLTGTFSSMPRYVLMDFLILPILVSLLNDKFKYYVITNIILLIVLLTFFIRGYWIA